MTTIISLHTICHHSNLLHYYWLHYLHSTFCPCGLLSYKFVLLNLQTSPVLPSLYPQSTTCVFSASVSLSLFLMFPHWFCFLDSNYEWDHVLFFSDLFHLAYPLLMFSQMAIFYSLFSLSNIHYIYISQIFIVHWFVNRLRLRPYLSYYK